MKDNIASFRSTLDRHLKAIQERNLEDFKPTIAYNVSTIDPNGLKVDGKKEFLDFHRSWFSQRNWERLDSVVTTSETDSMAYAVIQYQYIEKDQSGSPQLHFHAYQILVFQNLNDGWQLIYDQNTGIEQLNRSEK
jgi:ketosteroid isomerase-like protein